ncbi:uncharacterized protein LOC124926053 [Impatiens glandulifera]|uniref:uncharacterized protein LOC124926053 n=1 Tax=Impatiens glandulifera TaxID=253017 RepID=UPI001FB09ACD|nr:uncharacterized protein LOC124926053 [Impatiens glandulifera]
MVILEVVEAPPGTTVSPRISFSADFLNDCNNFITINPESCLAEKEIKQRSRNPDFEFLSGDLTSHLTISTADELFFEGKLLPFWDNRQIEKQGKMGMEEKNVGVEKEEEEDVVVVKKVEESRMNWFVDDDPSPRPPKCTVLWKELLRLKKQRAPTYLSPSPSSSSEKTTKGLERNRSGTLRIRPMVNVPISTHGKSNTLPSLFPQKQPQGGGGIRRHK